MKAKPLIFILILLSLTLLMGCWDEKQINNLAIVTAIGVDKSQHSNEFRFSFQVTNPGSIVTGTTGGGGSASPLTIYTETGATLIEAIRKVSRKVPRQLFFSHVHLLVIGEPVARTGIEDLFDSFERSGENRFTSLVLVSRNQTAESIISVSTPLEKKQAKAVVGQLEVTEEVWSENIKVEIDDVIRSMTGEDNEVIISGIKLNGNPTQGNKNTNIEATKPPVGLEISGIAIFKEGKLQRWLDGYKARGVVLIKNKMKNTVVSLDCKEKGKTIALENIHAKTEIKARVRNGKPIIDILIREEGDIGEVTCPIPLNKHKEIIKLEKKWRNETKNEVMAAVKIAQKEKSDILGFGTAVNLANPKAWRKMEKEWNEIFSEIQVTVKVDAVIRGMGLERETYLK